MALALVRSCHPRPGAAVNPAQAEYVIPDVFVRRTEHGWIVEINQATVPRVRVNNAYANLISRSPDHAMLRTQLQEARWLMRSLEIRNDTLIKSGALASMQRQTQFFRVTARKRWSRSFSGMSPIAVEMHDRRSRASPPPNTCTQCRAASFEVPVTFLLPATSRRRDGTEIFHRHPRQIVEGDFHRENPRTIRGATASSREIPVAGRHTGGPGAPLPNIAKACRTPRPTNGSERLTAHRKRAGF